MLDHVQIGRLLSRCTGTTSVHQVSQQIGHGNVDMGRSWRVSIKSSFPFSFSILFIYLCDALFVFLHPLQIEIVMVDINAVKQQLRDRVPSRLQSERGRETGSQTVCK